MSEQMILDLGRQALLTTLSVAGPMLAAALLIGLLVSLFQAVTQINEMTMTFVPKIVGILITWTRWKVSKGIKGALAGITDKAIHQAIYTVAFIHYGRCEEGEFHKI